MESLLNKTLICIESESDSFDKSFNLVDLLVKEYGESNLAERLYSEIDTSVPWEVVADLFSILIWSTSDNGASLSRTTEQWITECEDVRKISIALNLDVYPFRNEIEMTEKLQKIATLFPSLLDRCNDLIKSR